MKNTKFLSKTITFLVAILLLGGLFQTVWAAKKAKQTQSTANPISEEERPWAGTPWLVGAVLTAGAVAVGLKNAKRSHLG